MLASVVLVSLAAACGSSPVAATSSDRGSASSTPPTAPSTNVPGASTTSTLHLQSTGPSDADKPFLSPTLDVSQIASTATTDGNVNPYGVAVVPLSVGAEVEGDDLVTNFNAVSAAPQRQGTGTTIVEVAPDGRVRLFADLDPLSPRLACPGGIGLSTALAILPGGWVVVGSVPTVGGDLPSVNPAGCLIVLDPSGDPVETWTNPDIDGPWAMTWVPTTGGATLFVSNVLTRAGGGRPVAGLSTVVRLAVALPAGGPPVLESHTVVAYGFQWHANFQNLVLGPTGLALAPDGDLYVAESVGSSIVKVPSAETLSQPVDAQSNVVTSGGALDLPVGMALAPNGDLLVLNEGNGNVVEVSETGRQVATATLVRGGGVGDLIGLALSPGGTEILFANDGTNALDVAKVP